MNGTGSSSRRSSATRKLGCSCEGEDETTRSFTAERNGDHDGEAEDELDTELSTKRGLAKARKKKSSSSYCVFTAT